MKELGTGIAIALLMLAGIATSSAQVRTTTYPAGSLATLVAESVVVDAHGITPEKITRPVGPFLLCIRNRRGSHTEHFSLTLDSAGASEILSLDTSPQQFHGAILVDLLPGNYRLRLTNSSSYSVPIVIQQ